ncbi:hypothetical protein [Ideonella alba]|uniref:Uncharacterized protein n=1 Tax=Ideonella alba TaxID=2824118 RepID=A0A940YEA0_9BURK|nr:hypothetical protein [Ideonella alba]MBQ0931571.1 hypothetical protein [Ideonella alba]
MPVVTEFTQSMDKFKKATLPLSPSESFKGFRDSHKKILEALKAMDQVAGKTAEGMREAYGKYDQEVTLWLDKIDKQLLKETNKKPLQSELTKFKQSLAALGLDYRQTFTRMAEQESAESSRAETRETGKGVAQSMAQEVNQRKLDAAVKYMKEKRSEELHSQTDLEKKMLRQNQEMVSHREEAQKLLRLAEQDAADGRQEQAAKKADLLRRTAEQLQENAQSQYEEMDRVQKGFADFRSSLNWGAISKKFDLDAVANTAVFQKAYEKELKGQAGKYSAAIRLGMSCIRLAKATKEVANDVEMMAGQAVALSRSAKDVLEFVLVNLMDGKGKTHRAAFNQALSDEPKNSVDHQLHSLESALSSVKGYVQDFSSARNEEDRTQAADNALMQWDRAEIALLGAREQLNAAVSALGQAKSRVPSTLSDNPLVKKALMEMGSKVIERQRTLKEQAQSAEMLGKLLRQFKILQD